METEPVKVEVQPQPEVEKKVVKKVIKKTTNEPAQKQENLNSTTKQLAGPERAKPSAKTNMFEKKPVSSNTISGRKESKPITTIGNDIFKNRLSIFEKTGQNSNSNISKEDPGPKKLDPSKFGNFSQAKDSSTNSSSGAPTGVSNGIQARLNAYLESAKNRSKTVSHMDPVLNKIKEKNVNDEEPEADKEENEGKNNRDSDLDISADNDDKKDDLDDNLGEEENDHKANLENEEKKEEDNKNKSVELEKNEDDIEDV